MISPIQFYYSKSTYGAIRVLDLVTQKKLEKNAAKYQATVGFSPIQSTPILLYWMGNKKKQKEKAERGFDGLGRFTRIF